MDSVLLERASLIFLGRLKATIDGSGMAFFNLLDVWRIGRCFLVILDRLLSPGCSVVLVNYNFN